MSTVPIATEYRPPAGEKRHQIDHRTIKLIVGVIAVGIGPLTNFLAKHSASPVDITSISASYYVAGPAQTIFLGFLFAIAALLAAYNGFSTAEMISSKVAAVAALGVALFPCGCDGRPVRVPHAHEFFATIVFLILAYLALGFYRRARAKNDAKANARAIIYAICIVAIIGAIIVLALNGGLANTETKTESRVTFYGELVALVAFGISWLTASHFIPVLTTEGDRDLRRRGVDRPSPAQV